MRELTDLTDLLDAIGDGLHDPSVDHDAECWRRHDGCAVYRAVDVLTRVRGVFGSEVQALVWRSADSDTSSE